MRIGKRSSGLGLAVFGLVIACSGGRASVHATGEESRVTPTNTADTVAPVDTVEPTVLASAIPSRADADEPRPVPERSGAEERTPRAWTLLAGGDVLMDRSEAAGRDPFVGMVPSLGSADLSLINVEMALTTRGTPARKPFVFRAPASAATTIASAGVDVVSLANNHARDYGSIGLLDTVAAFDEAGVIAVGAGATAAEAYSHRIVEIPDGPRVAVIGVTRVVPTGFSATRRRAGVAGASGQRDRVLLHVRQAAKEADVVIVTIHWGIEGDACPSIMQRSFAQHLLDAGATAVLGHHPHVLQPVVTTGDQLVAYSLGNFVWRGRLGMTGETGILQLDFEDDRLAGWRFHPHRISTGGAPIPLSDGKRYERIVDIIAGKCAEHGA